ncbi:hypothetical protein ZIOFF_064444 [Zingiber officinale]|uniref:beta-ketoacyl-[acyl-carrier-protein] synthase I n=1 Tax=Zingiber officinale TaxID=94328 RepID=A0A8J5EVY5_ZINOF|nr:hypothetical protein ZIOFF_064444 [Zingiber officinale]
MLGGSSMAFASSINSDASAMVARSKLQTWTLRIPQLKAIRTGWIHPNINLDNPEKTVDASLLVGQEKERLDVKVALSNSFGFGGHNSSILFAPYK